MPWRRTHATQNNNSGETSLNTYTANSVMRVTRRVQVSAEKLKRSISAPFRSSQMRPLFLLAFIANSTDLFREWRQCVRVEPMAARPGEINNWSGRSGSICYYTTVGFDELFFHKRNFISADVGHNDVTGLGPLIFTAPRRCRSHHLVTAKIRHRVESHQGGDGYLCNHRTTIVGNWIVEVTWKHFASPPKNKKYKVTCGTKAI